MGELIVLRQEPIIEFSAMEERGLQVASEIREMNIDSLDATDENRSIMKKYRAQLNKDLKVFEDQRKMIHAKINAPYMTFKESYEENIKHLYEEATKTLAEKIKEVDTKLLEAKHATALDYFLGRNKHDFIDIESIGLKIILSVTDKKIRGQIDEFLDGIDSDVTSINSMDNSVRVLGHYQRTLNLSESIGAVNAEIKREEELEAKRIEDEKAAKAKAEKEASEKKEREEREAKERAEQAKIDAELAKKRRIQAEKNAKVLEAKEATEAKERAKREEQEAVEKARLAEETRIRLQEQRQQESLAEEETRKIHTMKFSVSGTIEQLKSMKQFIIDSGMTINK